MAEKPAVTVLKDVTIITVDQRRRIILNGHIVISGSRVTRVSSGAPDDIPQDAKIISLPGRIIIPGLINTHAHLAQSLLRGLAEDLPLHSWLCDRIWPLEAAYAGEGSQADGYVAARLTIAEMLKSGTTCFLEAMLTHRSGFANVARAVEEMGIRACLGKLTKGAESPPVEALRDARDKDLAHMGIPSLLDAHRVHDGTADARIRVWASLGTPRGAPLSAYQEVADACRARDMGITMHLAEAPSDPAIIRDAYGGRTPGKFCADAGLLGAKTVLAHMVHVSVEADGAVLARTGTTVAHNPGSNLKLSSGIAPVQGLLEAGVNVALGTDGAPCNNTYDMLREMHLAAMLHKGSLMDAGAVGAHAALEMATVHGARALGLGEEVGSLEEGKKADLVVLDVRGVWAAPWEWEGVEGGGMDPVGLVVGCCTGRDVEMVLVDGKVLVEGGRLVGVDEEEVVAAARRSIRGIRERSGVKAPAKAGWVVE
ncbi:5-methylthioadenosine/S-adenosylhomocysteine deaminase n1 [Coniochaeta ligniaria NRRL 30616]|uniref:5-methylthioadenosine/S-adenosylhomocysteine deaminase n1 n=1 Tax=Coniochaeta ligniaria NRRL 30616 TaxID=1408157 RepID=A0A1J7IQI8_9PEZI|nr:5-methylthioadenosine/S-adenosylhomocysteine deaminase n1 [Coniochaeta ligniaria NRRL 30616]